MGGQGPLPAGGGGRGAPRPPRSGGAAARGGRGAERSKAGGGCASAAMPNKNKKEKVSREGRERPSPVGRLWGAGPAGRRGLGWGAAVASGARSAALGEPRKALPRVRGISLPHCSVPASASSQWPGRGQLPAGPSPGVPKRGPGAVSPAAVGGREGGSLWRAAVGLACGGVLEGRGWETCP